MHEPAATAAPRHAWDEQYRRYQATLTVRYLIPTLRDWGFDPAGKRILEIGCGDGGCGAELQRHGAHVTALDIDARLVQINNDLNRREGVDVHAFVGDINDARCPGLERGPFDLVLLRDVVEHLDNLEHVLGIVSSHLAPNGLVFVDFPPYYSPFGAHQQILPRRKLGPLPYNKLPWIQLLPDALFLRLVAGDTSANHEVRRLRDIRLTLGKFERAVRRTPLRIRRRELHLLRPSFKLRYGLPVLGASFVGHVPGLSELLVTGAYFLLERDAS